jgi:flagellar hook-length control protein FliK
MISNVTPPATDTASVATPVGGDAGDSGLFDVLLTLQSLANPDPAAAATAGQATSLEGADLIAGELDDSGDDSSDDSVESTEPADDALWFLNAFLPAPKVSTHAGTAVDPVTAQVRDDSSAAGGGVQRNPRHDVTDLAQALTQTHTAGVAATNAKDASSTAASTWAPASQAASTAAIDTTSWSSLTGPAELFAQATKQGSVDRAEAAPLTTHVRDPRWAEDLGNRLATMVRTGDSSASLQLTPPDLGPLEVNVTVRDNQATVHFGAAQAETRALLEASMPRLREMLASQGFQLMDSSVSHGFARQTRHESAGTPRLMDSDTSLAPVQAVHIRGLVDLYA